MSFPPYSPTTTKQFNDAPLLASKNSANQAAYQNSLIESTPSATSDVTGVTLNFTGLTKDQISRPGARTLSYTSSGTLLAWDGGAGVDVHLDGTYTLVSSDGTKIKAVVVAGSLPVGNESDTIVVSSPIGLDDERVLYADGKFNSKVQSVPAVDQAGQISGQIMLGSMDVNTNRINKQPTNVTGVYLTLNTIAQSSQLVPGVHKVVFTASGTLLAVDGGTGVNIGAGGTFTLTAPDGTTVKAVVTAASLPIADQSDLAITVGSFPTQAKVINDPSLRASISAVYKAL